MPTNPPLDDIPEEAAFLVADRGADRVEKRVRLAFLSAVKDAVSSIDNNAFTAAATYRDGAFAEALVRQTRIGEKFKERLKDREAKAERESSPIDEAIEIGLLLGLAVLALSLTKEQIADFRDRASEYVAAEIDEQMGWVEDETAKAIGLVFLLLRRGFPSTEEVAGALARTFPPEIFRPMIGLNSKQIGALVARGKASVFAGVPVDAVKRQILQEAAVMLQQRAELVARSITERVINLSQQAAIERSVSLGLLSPLSLRQWITRGDGKVCGRCLAFHLVTARIDQPFISRAGETAWVPDIHPFGRCRMRIVAA